MRPAPARPTPARKAQAPTSAGRAANSAGNGLHRERHSSRDSSAAVTVASSIREPATLSCQPWNRPEPSNSGVKYPTTMAGQPEDDVPQERSPESQRHLIGGRGQTQALGAHPDRAATRLHPGVDDEPTQQQEHDDRAPDEQGCPHPSRSGERGRDHEPADEDDREPRRDEGVDQKADRTAPEIGAICADACCVMGLALGCGGRVRDALVDRAGFSSHARDAASRSPRQQRRDRATQERPQTRRAFVPLQNPASSPRSPTICRPGARTPTSLGVGFRRSEDVEVGTFGEVRHARLRERGAPRRSRHPPDACHRASAGRRSRPPDR